MAITRKPTTKSRAIGVALAVAFVATGCRNTAELRPVISDQKNVPAGALDGTVIYGSKDDSGGDIVATIDISEGRGAQVLSRRSGFTSPQASPDETKVAYVSTAGERGIYVSTLGEDPLPIVTGPGFFYNPTWSPDGSQIAYAYTSGVNESLRLFVVDSDGGEPAALTEPDVESWHPAWRPGRNELAYVSDRDGDNAVWLLDLSTGQSTKLVDDVEGQDTQPAWTPDGEMLVFTSDREFERWQLFKYDFSTGTDTNLIRTDSVDRNPTVSPDGEYVLATADGFLAVYRTDGEEHPDGADRWKANDTLTEATTWLRGSA